MTVLYAICSLCMFLTMVFFASGVCDNGCTIEKAGIFAILAAFMWLFAAGASYKSTPMDSSVPKATCCCCPLPIETGASAYKAIPIEEHEVKQESKALVAEPETDEEAKPETAQSEKK